MPLKKTGRGGNWVMEGVDTKWPHTIQLQVAGGGCPITGIPITLFFFQWAGNNEIYTNPKRAFVKLPKYKDEEKIYLAIHFFPNDNIKAFVTNLTPDYPEYPYGWPQDDDPKRKKKIGKRHAAE